MKILITGINGFIGQALCIEACKRGISFRGAVRRHCSLPNHIDVVSVGDIGSSTNWDQALDGCDVVVHLAARAHNKSKVGSHQHDEFRNVNLLGTINLAKQAARAGVRRFIFISSIGVNGAESFLSPISYIDKPAPYSPYAVSKHEAELSLIKISNETDMDFVIIRPPLVYGPNAPGNFGSLIRWISRGLPLPFGRVVQNRRSYVAIDNLVDLILTCVYHPNASNQIFLVSDGEDISTKDFVKKIAEAMNKSIILIPVPISLIKFFFSFLGKKLISTSLLCSLQLDINKTCSVLNWTPPISLSEGLCRAVGKKN